MELTPSIVERNCGYLAGDKIKSIFVSENNWNVAENE